MVSIAVALVATGWLGVPAGRADRGGPDAFGYIWEDSNAPAPQVVPSWTEIQATGTPVSNFSDTNDGFAGPLPLGFAFEFYGTGYTDVYIGTNGYLTFGAGDATVPIALPSGALPDNVIMPFGADLFPGGAVAPAGVYYETLATPNRFVVEFLDIPLWGVGLPQTFQVVLFSTGEIRFEYLSITAAPNAVGIEDATASAGLAYAPVVDGLAVRFRVLAVEILPETRSTVGIPGQTVTLPFFVTNRQSTPDTFDLTASGTLGWTVEFWDAADTAPLADTGGSPAPDTGVLASFVTIAFNVHVAIPGGASPGDLETSRITATSASVPGFWDDSLVMTQVPVSPDWLDDMELGPAPWTAATSGGIDEWEWGSPSVTGPLTCFSGAACWGTDLTGTYDVGFDASLYPPAFDLTAVSSAELSFAHWFEIAGDSPPNSADDGAFLEASSDGGISWSKLTPTAGQPYQETMDGSAPYPGGAAFGQQSGGWVLSRVDLSPYSGSILQVRFRLWDDTPIGPNGAGWYVDDVRLIMVRLDLAPDLSTGADAPGTAIAYPMTVTNLQAAPDTFDLTATGTLGWAVEFWDSTDTSLLADTAGSPAPDTGVVAASGTFAFSVHVLIPGGAAYGDTESTVVTATPVGGGTGDVGVLRSMVAYVVPFSDPFDPAPLVGWALWDDAAGTQWEWGTPSWGATSCASPPACYGTNLASAYTNGAVADLISPPISLPAFPVSLSFEHWYSTESCCDPATVAVSTDGGLFWSNLATYAGSGTSWRGATFSLAAFTGSTAMFRFRLTTDGSVVYPGWFIDDVRVGVNAVSLLPSASSAWGAAGGTVVYPMTATNLQAAPDTFDLTATGTLGWTVEFWDSTDTVLLADTAGSPDPDTGVVAAFGSFAFNAHVLIPAFAAPGDLEASLLTATSASLPIASDVSRLDTGVIVTPPWFDDMELGPAPWTAATSGGIDEWEWGAPSLVGPAVCFSGAACWGTDLTGTYDLGFDASLAPPPFDLSLALQAEMTFAHWFEVAGDSPPSSVDDGAFLEISTDGGLTWGELTPTSGTLYNETMDAGGPYPGGPVFGQQSGGWVLSTVDLTPYLGGIVQVRFRLWDDTSVGPNGAGWYVDDFALNQIVVNRGVRLTPPTQYQFTDPSMIVDFAYTAQNLGILGVDAFDLDYASPRGWPAAFFAADGVTPLSDTAGSGLPDTGPLATGATVDFILRVQVPPGVRGLETFTVTAASAVDPLASDTATAEVDVRPTIFSAWAATAPAVDGVVDAAEWAGAWREDLAANVTANPMAGSVLVMNDATHLYVAVDAVGDTRQDFSDFMSLTLDTDRSRTPTSQGDDAFEVRGNPGSTVHYRYNQPWGGYIPEDSPFDTALPDHASLQAVPGFGPTALSGTSHRVYELAIPLPLIQSVPGDVLGLLLGKFPAPNAGLGDWWTGQQDSWPYVGAPDFTRFGDLQLATPFASTALSVTGTSLAPAVVNQGQTSVLMEQFRLETNALGDGQVVVDDLTVGLGGSPPSGTDVAAVRVYHDLNGNRAIDVADPLLDQAVFSGLVATFANLGLPVASGTPEYLLVTFDVAAAALPGNTVGIVIPDETYITLDQTLEADGVLPFANLASGNALIQGSPETVDVLTRDIAPATARQGATDVVVLLVNVSVPGAGAAVVQGLTVHERGTAADADFRAVRAYRDADSSGTLTAGDVRLGSDASIAAGLATLTFSQLVTNPVAVSILIAVDLAPGARTAATVVLSVQDSADVTVAPPDTVQAFAGVDSGPTTIRDVTPPTSSVNALPTFQPTRSFTVGYSATDNPGGSGVRETEVWQRQGAGPWVLLGTYTSSPQSVTVPADGFYEYYSVSTDVAGNREGTPPAAQAYTTVGVAVGTTGTVSGIVIDQGGSPVPGVTVTVVGTGLTATTDSLGGFTVAAVPVGAHDVSFEGTGYPARLMEGVVVTGGGTVVLNPVVLVAADLPPGPATAPVVEWIAILVLVAAVALLLVLLLRRRRPLAEQAAPPSMPPYAPPPASPVAPPSQPPDQPLGQYPPPPM